MRQLTANELENIDGGIQHIGVSKETWSCAVGSYIGSIGGAGGIAAGCIAGAYIANNWNGWIGDAFGSLNNVNLTM